MAVVLHADTKRTLELLLEELRLVPFQFEETRDGENPWNRAAHRCIRLTEDYAKGNGTLQLLADQRPGPEFADLLNVQKAVEEKPE